MNDDFSRVVLEYEKLIYTICYKFVRNHHDAENLTQDTFLSAYKVFDKLDNNNAKAYITRIAINKCKDYLKSYNYSNVVCMGFSDNCDIADSNSCNNYTNVDFNEDLKQNIDSLREPYSTVSRMYFLDGCTLDDISQTLNRSVKTVSTQVYRARNMLRDILKGVYNGG